MLAFGQGSGREPPKARVFSQYTESNEQNNAVDVLHTLCVNTAVWNYKQSLHGKVLEEGMEEECHKEGTHQHVN